MDFDSLLSSEISKNKPDKGRKFVRRADLEAERRAAYEAEQKSLEEKRKARAAEKRKAEEDEEAEKQAREERRRKLAEESRRRREEQEKEEERKRRKRLGLPELVESTGGDEETVGEGEEDIAEEELVEKLRGIGAPAVLFGESHVERLRRYRKLTVVVTSGPIPTTLQLVEGKDMKVDGTVPKDKDGRKYLFRQLASYFMLVLSEYEIAMEKEKRDTLTSKTAYNAMVQTRENMKPVSPAPGGEKNKPYPESNDTRPFSVRLHPSSPSSSFGNSKKASSKTRSWSPSWRLSRRRRNGATCTPTTATSVSASARRRGRLV